MLNILHAIDTTGPGGAETIFMSLAKHLDQSRFRSFVAIPASGWLQMELEKNGIAAFLVGGQKGFDIGYLIRLVKIIREKRIDIVQSHLFGSNLYCCIAGAITGVPVVCTFHGSVDIGKRGIAQRVKLSLIKYLASRIIFVSKVLGVEVLGPTKSSSLKYLVIYNGIDTNLHVPRRDNTIRNQLGLHDKDILIGAAGNIRPAKDYEMLLRAAAQLTSKSQHYKIVIAGDNKNPLFDRLIIQRRELELEHVVHFIGFQPNIPMYLNNLDIFVLSSKSEGFSMATIEAMACEVPVVATKSGGPEEIIQSGINGLLVDAGDASGLASRIHELASDRLLGRNLAMMARKNVLDKFSIRTMLDSYIKVYSELR